MAEESVKIGPDSEVIESEYYRAEVTIGGEPGEIAKRVALTMRMQNAAQPGARKLSMAPVEWHPLEGEAKIAFAGRVFDLRDSWNIDKFRCAYGITVSCVKTYLDALFGQPVEVRPLYNSMDHIEDMAIMDAIKDRFDVGIRWENYRTYPTTDDVLSAGKHEAAILGSQGSYARKSSCFTAVLRTKTPSAGGFDRAAYSAACRNLMDAAGVKLAPRSVVDLGGGLYEIKVAGQKFNKGFFGASGPAPADESVADPIAYYLDSEVEMRTYGTTVLDAEDIVAAEKVLDDIVGLGLPEPEDFHVVPAAEAREAEERGEEAVRPEPELTGREELERLIGIDDVAGQILEFAEYAAVQKERGGTMPSLHMLMTGNPGTGKTTVARAIGHLYHDLGLIAKRNVFVEGDRETLVGRYVGETAIKTKAAIGRARRGILFIDEAYALAPAGRGTGNDFGAEALATLVKAMEDCRQNFARDGFVCIMAGYPDLMEEMVSVNPGLRDRFGLRLEFPDYSADELVRIFELYAADERYTVKPGAKAELRQMFGRVVDCKDGDFSNARLVRKVFERCMMRQARLFGADSRLKKATIESVFQDDDLSRLLSEPGSTSSRFGKAGFSVGFQA